MQISMRSSAWLIALVLPACGGKLTSDGQTGGKPAVDAGSGGGVSIGGSGGTGTGGIPQGGAGGGGLTFDQVWQTEIDEDKDVQWDGIRALDGTYDSVVMAANSWPENGNPAATAMELAPGSEALWIQTVDVEAIDIIERGGSSFVLSRTGDPLYSVVKKLSSNGVVEWTKPAIVSKEGSEPSALAVDEYDRITVVGTVYTDDGKKHAYVAQLMSDGAPQWSRLASADSWAIATDIAADQYMSLTTVYEYAGTLEVEGEKLANAGERDLAVARWSASGGLAWVESFSTEADERNARIAVNDGKAYVVWTADGTLNVRGLGADGTTSFTRTFGPAKTDALAVAVGWEALYVAGTFVGTLELGPTSLSSDSAAPYGETFLLKLALDGSPLASAKLAWQPLTSFCADYRPISLALDYLGNLYVAGGACLSPGSELLKFLP